jgi:hypothetical protein
MDIQAYAAVAGVIVSLLVFAYQTYRGRFRTSIDLALKLKEQFDSRSFGAKRHSAASALLINKMAIEAEPIYDFFDMVGLLVRKGAIDREIAWSIFYDWVHGYWSNGAKYIGKVRAEKKDKTIWDNFEKLHKVLLEIQRREGNQSEPKLMPETEKTAFLEEEKSLLQS